MKKYMAVRGGKESNIWTVYVRSMNKFLMYVYKYRGTIYAPTALAAEKYLMNLEQSERAETVYSQD